MALLQRIFRPNVGNPAAIPLAPGSTWNAFIVDDKANEATNRSRLIVGMDLGMTYSGVSYACVRPGPPPRVCDVIFKGQEDAPEDSKVPTILFRDTARDKWYRGAETARLTEDTFGLVKLEWFKLQLLQDDGDEAYKKFALDLTPVDLFGTFFKYMHECLRAYFEVTQFNGQKLWEETVNEATYVVTHPNNWSGWHQDQLRRALIAADIIGSQDGPLVTFLSEGEAGLHWWLKEDPQQLHVGDRVVICDAGGGTIDVSSYCVTQAEPLKVGEINTSDTRKSGAIFVNRSFRDYLQKKLKGSSYERTDRIDRMVEKFETGVKRIFANAQATQRIEFGFTEDNDEEYDIKNGILSVSGEAVAGFFEPSCKAAIEAIRRHASKNCYVVLVGGLSGSPWFIQRVSGALRDITPNVKKVPNQPGKAVARGAVEFCVNNRVTSRVARRTLGLPLEVLYDGHTPSHINRQSRAKTDPVSGLQLLPGRLRPLVTKGDVLPDGSTIRVRRTEYVASDKKPHKVVFELVEYTGRLRDVEFTDMDEASTFPSLGQFKARIPPAAFRRVGSDSAGGKEYWEVKYYIAFAMGQTEIKGSVEWVEGDKTKEVDAVARWKRH